MLSNSELQNFIPGGIPGEVDEEAGASRGIDEEEIAATKIQASMRGKTARREFVAAKPPDLVDDDGRVDNAPASARLAREMTVPDDVRLSASDGMVSPKTRRASKNKLWDSAQIQEVILSKSELVKKNAELAVERRRQELVDKQAQKEIIFKQMQEERRKELAEKRRERNRIRAGKLKKISENEAKQQEWKEFMHQKIAGENLRQQEIDAVNAATIVEAQERRHQATESQPGVKGSYLDAPLREASKLPGPGAYDRKEERDHRAAKLGNATGKSALDWSIYRAKQIPGPAEYSPMESNLLKNTRGIRISRDSSKSALDWEIYRAEQMPGPAAYSVGEQSRTGGKSKVKPPRFGANESKSMIDWVIHNAKKMPGPADYDAFDSSSKVGVRFSNARPPTDLEITIHRAKTLPGPGQYGAPMTKRNLGFRFNQGEAKSSVDWEIYRAKQVRSHSCRALGRYPPRHTKGLMLHAGRSFLGQVLTFSRRLSSSTRRCKNKRD